MNVFTVVVTGSIVCSLAYAAHQGRPVSAQPDGAGNRSVTHEGLVLGQRPKGHTMAALGGGGDDCFTEESLNWLGTVRPLPACFSYDMHNGGIEDWNGDGVADFVKDKYGIMLLQSGVAQPAECLAYLSTTHWDGEEVTMTKACIETSESLIAYALANFPGSTVESLDGGWRDFDGDGDLDYCVQLSVNNWSQTPWIWIENTGFEADPPLAADINQDGVVDGKDLAAVLAGWTP